MASRDSTRPELSACYVRSVLDYDPATGALTWKPRTDIANSRIRNTWNSRFAGRAAGSIDAYGYVHIRLCGYQLKGHRIAWLHTHGSWPAGQLDHINGVRTDNRIANLREATPSENSGNTRRHADNQCGLKGVYRVGKRWVARIHADGKSRHLGRFDAPEEAHAAYCVAAHELFGEFARTE